MAVAKKINILFILLSFAITANITSLSSCNTNTSDEIRTDSLSQTLWYGWNKYQIKPEDTLVRLGHDIIENTSYYFGPKGKIATITNGMNCQNCHIQSGIIPYGNNFSAVISTYPRFSNRMNNMMSVSRRINDCFERSLNGEALDTTSYEMLAIIAYMHWIGDDIPHGKKPRGSGLMQLPFLDRAADPNKGKIVYLNFCQRCHGTNGEGQPNSGASGYVYPPLWGNDSYNEGAGLYRISGFAGFVKTNMPFMEANYKDPKLTDEQAWDVAAYVNTQPHPPKKNKNDFPDISKKTFDEPFCPYSDTFSEVQHKYGPYKPITESRGK